ncbi:MAG: 2-oxoacid:acceptor oxidoreductase subunit alpha [Desulfoprunum sp.]|nr:2-oxoacid:acceptor oxidoreductase subunit alpha [Desulfoprunum sp.]
MKTIQGCTVVLGGEAGQGVQYIETVLVRVAKDSGFHVFATKEYMSRVRGGINTTEIRLHTDRLRAHVDRIDLLVALKTGVIAHLGRRVTEQTLIVGEQTALDGAAGFAMPLSSIATEIGNKIYANSVALGFICGLLRLDRAVMIRQITARFSVKGEDVSKSNIRAAEKGYGLGEDLRQDQKIILDPGQAPGVAGELLMSGADAVALGALAGGCNAVFAYPMTPGTGVFTLMAQFSHDLDIVVEQVEDEMGVVNMALGAWYAGARALVSTSGGGFALMTEGLSLAGMTETPLVVHLAQRPGPATGLPTRTEQGDLNLALYAGHGEFPRIILAPSDLEQAFSLTRQAFNLADACQVPVILLTDQYFVDSISTVPDFKGNLVQIDNRVIKTGDDYKRYLLTENGISPRGIPGFGSGNVCVDSDEHDEQGRITEDLDGVRVPMADKRMRKLEILRKMAIEPELVGPIDYKVLLVTWGSTTASVQEALIVMGNPNMALLSCPQLYPLPASVAGYLQKAEKVIAIEGNQTGQFADLLHKETGVAIKQRILKYNGMPFSVEELVERIGGEL